ncbi:hypothetical protein Tco_0033989 [Tanacetum coccineum]
MASSTGRMAIMFVLLKELTAMVSETHDEPVRNVREEPKELVDRCLGIKEDKKKLFILGTHFLTTAKAEIRFDKGTTTLKSGIKEDKKKLFILGTHFLTTAKAEIRFDKGTTTLKSGKNKMNFFKILESPHKVEEETENDIDPVPPTNVVSRLILE